MSPDGYVPVSQILSSKHPKLSSSSWTLQDIEQIVKTCNKQRFQLDYRPVEHYPKSVIKESQETNHDATDPSDTILCLRATQGHTLKFIDPELLLTPIPPDELAKIPTIVHGTYQQPWQTSISQQGLHCMKRNHIHFAPGLPRDQAGGVISGMRQTSDVYIYVSAAKCAANPNIRFYRSTNGVLLTAGVDGNGTLPVDYFSHVTDPEGTLLLDQRTSSDANANGTLGSPPAEEIEEGPTS